MARRDTIWAVQRRAKLVKELGGKCAKCGSKEKLEIDHVNGRDWTPRKVSSDTRVRRYVREAKEGKLRVLCQSCNGSWNPSAYAGRDEEE